MDKERIKPAVFLIVFLGIIMLAVSLKTAPPADAADQEVEVSIEETGPPETSP